MAANPQDDLVNVEVDGKPAKARKGAMIIHVTDQQGAYVPRFCYHDKLPVAANCRMCLVEVEKAPKPLPACATPVAEGMKIFTRSKAAIGAQKATMEFLLINHPLDCPICDQGGECELQDLALGYGRDIARFNERKRVVKDKNLGPLVSTDMTRCIHCTRCVRFGQDIAGIPELGTTGRGENMQIGTWIERSVDHELSGNIIDLCPVGALNSKPFRYQGRSWEMTQLPFVSPHDGFGSNLFGHVLRGKLKRVVPRPNDDINETWIADRDRFSYEGIHADDRLLAPLIRDGGEWRAASWEEALGAAARGLKAAGPSLGTLVHPSSTIEELHLAARLTRGLGSANIDHRLRSRDFRDAAADPRQPALGNSLAAVDALSGVLVIGSNLRAELPLLAHRLRKAVVRARAKVAFVDSIEREYRFPVAAQVVRPAAEWAHDLAGILAAVCEATGLQPGEQYALLLRGIAPTAAQRAAAAALCNGNARAVWLGAMALRHPAAIDLRSLAGEIARLAGATFGVLAEGANAAGAWLAGAVPHRGAGGVPLVDLAQGLNLRGMLETPQRAYLLVGAIEPAADIADAALASRAFESAACVVAITPFVTEELRRSAHVLLPMGSFAETAGTYVNLEGRWQGQSGLAKPPGEARPGWKILRVLGNALELDGFGYESAEDVRRELEKIVEANAGAAVPTALVTTHLPAIAAVAGSADLDLGVLDVPMYAIDAVLRRSGALQQTRIAGAARASTGGEG
ncbi:MAG: NADH-quinone oxidoreductase subunit NuoG [Gammaproteobacteria bacterium]|nr:NADH-quinone oxidoreductase subunit NuoG [Gammaproteobacteria bacterium]